MVEHGYNSGFDHSANHYSDCTGPYCDCDERRYGSRSAGSWDWILVVLSIIFGLAFPPLGFLFMLIFIFK